MPKKRRPGSGPSDAPMPQSPLASGPWQPRYHRPTRGVVGVISVAVASIAIGMLLLWAPNHLLRRRHPYHASVFISEDESYNEVEEMCGDYHQASILRRGFSHIPIQNYLLPLHNYFNVSSFILQPHDPSLMVLPNSDVFVVFRLSNFHHCSGNLTQSPPPSHLVTRIGAMVLNAKLQVSTQAHILGGLNYDSQHCNSIDQDDELHPFWNGVDEPTVFWFLGEPWLLLTMPLQEVAKAANGASQYVLKCKLQYVLCPLHIYQSPISCQTERLVTLKLPKGFGDPSLNSLDSLSLSHQRQWSPFEQDGKLYISRRLEPHAVLQVSVTTGNTKLVHQSSNPTLADPKCHRLQGAGQRPVLYSTTPAIPVTWEGEPRLLAVGRHVGFTPNKSFSFFYMIRVSGAKGKPEFPIAEISREFCIADEDGHCERLQSVGGVAQQGGRFLLAYGANGCEARLAILPLKDYIGTYLQY